MNLLAHEKSPYLLQHAHNPVDWMPWGPPAFEKAATEGKPIFLSIGYSTCHWCHVMEKESFEDGEIAAMLNRDFVSVKVDREERPDLDAAFMTVCQMLNGHGGWPLTLVLTPEQHPFFAATYIPKYSRGEHRPGLMDLLPVLASTYRDEPERIREITTSIRSHFDRIRTLTPSPENRPGWDDACAQHLVDSYDPVFGGFGQAPKFPTPQNLLFLLDHGQQRRDRTSLKMVRKTLKRMRYGGIYDQIGYGFHRYSTDRAWKLPHFEKMLYDQAYLLLAYSKGAAHLHHNISRRTCHEIVEFVKRKLMSPEGLFYSGMDADSEGEEGRYYTWTHSQLRQSLSVTESALLEEIFHIRMEGNYLEETSGYPNGTNILHLADDIGEFSEKLGMDKDDFQSLLDDLRAKLLALRMQRVPPATDDKILTDWNGYMIHALARASVYLDEPSFLSLAEQAWRALRETLCDGGQIYHRWREGERAIRGFAHDYVSMALAALALFEASGDPIHLEEAIRWEGETDLRFRHEPDGGLFTCEESDALPLGRQMEVIDTAVPSLNSLYGWLCHRLFRITGETRYRDRYDECQRLVHGFGDGYAGMAPFLARAGALDRGPSTDIVLSGRRDDPVLFQMLEVSRSFAFQEPVILIIDERTESLVHRLCPFTAGIRPEEQANAHVCSNHACELPIDSPERLHQRLRELMPSIDTTD